MLLPNWQGGGAGQGPTRQHRYQVMETRQPWCTVDGLLDEEDVRQNSHESMSESEEGLLEGDASRERLAGRARRAAKLTPLGTLLLLAAAAATLAAAGSRRRREIASDFSFSFPRIVATGGDDLRESLALIGLQALGDCHTSLKGEECYASVVWQMTNSRGVMRHPEWNANVTENSSFEEFQAWMHKQTPDICPRPCPPNKTKAATDETRAEAADLGNGNSGDDAQKAAKKEDERCHTATEGEACHSSVAWAMTDGIFAHPDWYDGLTKSSEFEDFQAAIHRLDPAICPQPCSPSHLATATVEVLSIAGGVVDMLYNEKCATASPGDSCYKDVEWAMQTGIYLHPEWYDPLTDKASAKDFQMIVHIRNRSACLPPCGVNASAILHGLAMSGSAPRECRTALEGEPCFESVSWAMHDGVNVHPEWYPGLNKSSSFEDFQALVHRLRPASCPLPCKCATAEWGDTCFRKIESRAGGGLDTQTVYKTQLQLHQEGNEECARPCKVRPKGDPSLFCFSIVQRECYNEVSLIETQSLLRAGIFDCDEFAVLSTGPWSLSGQFTALTFEHAEVGVSDAGTAANAELFMNAWEAIKQDRRWARYDWVVKVDPDAVLLPSRLRRHLALHHRSQGVYVQNCDRYGGPSLFGSLEAFSHEAVQKYFDSGPECRDQLEWHQWGEDVFMACCLDHIGVESSFDEKLIGDARCYSSNCWDSTSAAYHPFKSVGEWKTCWEQAMGRQ